MSVMGMIGSAIASEGMKGLGSALGGWLGTETYGRTQKEWADAASATQWNREYGAYKNRYQDTMKDMRAAGLNPILAASGGFNVSGLGPHAQMPSYPTIQGQGGDPASAMRVLSQNERDESAAKVNIATVKKVKNEGYLAAQKIITERAKAGKLKAEENVAWNNVKKVVAEITKYEAEAYNLAKQGGLADTRKATESFKRQELEWKSRQLQALTQQLQLEMSKLINQDEIYRGPGGKLISYAEKLLNMFNIGAGVFLPVGKRR